MKMKTLAGAGFALLFAWGCAPTYYRVTDPTTGKDYYTTDLKTQKGGAATLKDARTGNMVNLQNSEIATVTKEQYEAGRFAPQPAQEKADPNPFGGK